MARYKTVPRADVIDAMIGQDRPVTTGRQVQAVDRILERRWRLSAAYFTGYRDEDYDDYDPSRYDPRTMERGMLAGHRDFSLWGIQGSMLRDRFSPDVYKKPLDAFMSGLSQKEDDSMVMFGGAQPPYYPEAPEGWSRDWCFDLSLAIEGKSLAPPALTTRFIGRIMQLDDYLGDTMFAERFKDEQAQRSQIPAGMAATLVDL
jgi:hypothetical protein